MASDGLVLFLQIVFGLLVFILAGLVFFTIYQITNPKFKQFNKGWLHDKKRRWNKDEAV